MTRAVRSTRPGCGWPTRWTRSGSRSNGTWTRKRGVRGDATEPVGRLHRQGTGPGASPEQEAIRRHVETIQEVAATLDPAAKTIGPASVRLRRDPRSPRRRRRSDPRADGRLDAELPRRPLRRRGRPAIECKTTSIWSGGSACPRGMSVGSTAIAMRGCGSSRKGRRWCMALDAHHTHPEPFGVDDLLPYRSAREPACQRQAIHRRKVMRKARSKTKRPKLLAELERRYLAVSSRL